MLSLRQKISDGWHPQKITRQIQSGGEKKKISQSSMGPLAQRPPRQGLHEMFEDAKQNEIILINCFLGKYL